jgi:hypothetical protein
MVVVPVAMVIAHMRRIDTRVEMVDLEEVEHVIILLMAMTAYRARLAEVMGVLAEKT